MRPALPLAVASLLAAINAAPGCASTPAPTGDDLGDALRDAHAQAVGDYHLLQMRQPPGGARDGSTPCAELCHTSGRACQTAEALCDHTAPDPRCEEAQSSCAWTVSLLPLDCRYCRITGP